MSTAALCIATGCAQNGSVGGPPNNASESFARAINDQDIEAAMSHWSDDALLYFQTSGDELIGTPPAQVRGNYERLFKEQNPPQLCIQVQGMELLGAIDFSRCSR